MPTRDRCARSRTSPGPRRILEAEKMTCARPQDGPDRSGDGGRMPPALEPRSPSARPTVALAAAIRMVRVNGMGGRLRRDCDLPDSGPSRHLRSPEVEAADTEASKNDGEIDRRHRRVPDAACAGPRMPRTAWPPPFRLLRGVPGKRRRFRDVAGGLAGRVRPRRPGERSRHPASFEAIAASAEAGARFVIVSLHFAEDVAIVTLRASALGTSAAAQGGLEVLEFSVELSRAAFEGSLAVSETALTAIVNGIEVAVVATLLTAGSADRVIGYSFALAEDPMSWRSCCSTSWGSSCTRRRWDSAAPPPAHRGIEVDGRNSSMQTAPARWEAAMNGRAAMGATTLLSLLFLLSVSPADSRFRHQRSRLRECERARVRPPAAPRQRP